MIDHTEEKPEWMIEQKRSLIRQRQVFNSEKIKFLEEKKDIERRGSYIVLLSVASTILGSPFINRILNGEYNSFDIVFGSICAGTVAYGIYSLMKVGGKHAQLTSDIMNHEQTILELTDVISDFNTK